MARVALWCVASFLAVADAVAQQPVQPSERVIVANPPKAIADFALTDQEGRDIKLSSLRGAPVLVFFGFAHCPDICPATLNRLQRLKRSAPEEFAQVRVVMISVDGDRDTPLLLKEYLDGFSPEFIGLTGNPATVREIAARFPAVFAKGTPATPGGPYPVQHSSLVYALDRDGMLRAQMDDADVTVMAGVVRSLLGK